MTKEEALDLALEALEGVVKNCWRDIPSWRLDEIKERINAIKQARSAPVQSCYCPNCEAMGKELAALKAQPAPVQEPVAWMHWLHGPVQLFMNKQKAMMELDRLNREYPVDNHARKMRSLVFGDTTPPAQPAPAPGYCKHCKQYSIEEPLPAAQRQWTGLTDEEEDAAFEQSMEVRPKDASNKETRRLYARAIEAKLKEKNTP
jgi:hypothetical protein